jgi:uroporphyrinogen-III synthase
MPMRNFQGLAVLTLESRRGQEMIKLIESYGGRAVHAPAMREVPLSSNPEALNFADGLFAGRFDIVIFLTGAGARALLHVLEDAHPKERVLEHLRKVSIIARGPKPVVVLREWKVPIALTAPEPNTWHELLQAIDASQPDLRGKRIAVQEYGVSNPGLIEGLGQRGANVTSVPVYRWELPEDTGPLRAAVTEVIASRIDVALFTTGVQIDHFFQIAEQERKKDELKAGMERLVKASIGPMTSDTLRGHGLLVDLEASHPKMGFLVKEAAEQAQALLQQIRPRPR